MKSEFPILGLSAKLALFGFAVLAFFIYLPAFVTTFGMQNDYSFLGYSPSQDWLGFPETQHLFAIGRPIGAVLLNIQGLFLRSLESFEFGRLCSFVVSLGSVWLAVQYLAERLQIEATLAAAIGFCLLLLPGSQIFILWLTNFVPGALNMFFALCCYRILDKVELLVLLRGNWRALGLMLGAIGVFFLTLCIYPPTALTFLALTFANILFSRAMDWPKIRLKVTRDLVFAGVGMLLYLVAIKIILLPLFSAYGSDAYRETVANINLEGGYRFELSRNLADKLGEFVFLSTLAIGGSLHAIIGDNSVWIMGGLTVTAFVYVAIRAARVPGVGMNWSWIAQKSAFGLLIILCASSPSLMAEKGQTGYRVVSTYEFIALLCLFAPLQWLSRMTPDFSTRSLAVALALVSGCLAGWNVSDVARFANRELLFVRQKLETADKDKLATVIGIYREPAANYLEWPVQLEFRCEISHIHDLAGVVKALLPESGFGDRGVTFSCDKGRKQVTLPSASSPGVELPPILVICTFEGLLVSDEQTVLIDFNELSISGPRPMVHLPSIRTSSGSGGRTLFDTAMAGDWRPGPAPQWVKLTVPDGTLIKRIVLCAGSDADTAAAMPKDCRIMASQNEIEWFEIGLIRGQDKWKAGEERSFAFAHPVNARHYLFVITAGNGPLLKLYKIKL